LSWEEKSRTHAGNPVAVFNWLSSFFFFLCLLCIGYCILADVYWLLAIIGCCVAVQSLLSVVYWLLHYIGCCCLLARLLDVVSLLSVVYWLAILGYWLLAIGYWLLSVVYWLLSVGYWLLLLAVGYFLSASSSSLALVFGLALVSLVQRNGLRVVVKTKTPEVPSFSVGH
jgi:hypothetical protein